MKTVLLAGAGFSRWSCKLPLVGELFDFAIRTDTAVEERRLLRIKKKYQSWLNTHPSDHPEVFIKFAQDTNKGFNLVNWYITRRLAEPFIVKSGRRYTWYINSYHPGRNDGISKARALIEALRSTAPLDELNIVTTNYDLIIEYCLGTRGFNYGVPNEQIGFTPYPYPRPLYVTGGIQISKLHGSISWSETAKFPDSRLGLSGKCLVVPPIAEKTAPTLLKRQWQFAKKALIEADNFVVFGFSFNEQDAAIRKFMSKSVSAKTKIILVDVVDFRTKLRILFDKQILDFVDATQDNLADAIRRAIT
jgi:hypothetical protein